METLKEFSSFDIIAKQKEQHSNSKKKNLTVRRRPVRLSDIDTIKSFMPDARSVLCVGSREDSEVLDFIDAGFDAVGTDILEETSFIREIDAHKLNEYFDEDSFDVVYASHVLEHALDARLVMRHIRSIAKQGVFIVLPVTAHRKPGWKHPTVFEIMKVTSKEEMPAMFVDLGTHTNIWSDFSALSPFEVIGGSFRDGLTEPREVWMCLKF